MAAEKKNATAESSFWSLRAPKSLTTSPVAPILRSFLKQKKKCKNTEDNFIIAQEPAYPVHFQGE
jgi:hypothetical protein